MDINDMYQETEHIKEQKMLSEKITENSIISFLNKKANDVINGNEYGYKVALIIKGLEDALKVIKEQIKEDVISEIEQPFDFNGFRIEKTQSGRYDYSHNEQWKKLENEKKQLEKDMQLAYKSDKQLIDEETGEIIEPAIYKPNKESYKFTKLK